MNVLYKYIEKGEICVFCVLTLWTIEYQIKDDKDNVSFFVQT